MVKKNNKLDSESSTDEKVIKDKTFVLKIKYNQNHSIQGSIQWVEQKKVVYFRSMMELILLLSESVEDKDIRSWNEEDGMLSILNTIGK